MLSTIQSYGSHRPLDLCEETFRIDVILFVVS
jgi:hypothetical protein